MAAKMISYNNKGKGAPTQGCEHPGRRCEWGQTLIID